MLGLAKDLSLFALLFNPTFKAIASVIGFESDNAAMFSFTIVELIILTYLWHILRDPMKHFPLRICLLILALAAYEDLLAQWVQSHWLATGLLMSIFWVCYHFMTKEIENLKSVYAGAPLKKSDD